MGRIGKPHGDAACFSFHPRKLVSTGDGGMITTKPDWDKQFRLWRQHAMSVPDTVRHSSNEVIFETYPELGFNYRMTDIQAAVGREQLKKLPALSPGVVNWPAAIPACLRMCPDSSLQWNPSGRAAIGKVTASAFRRAAIRSKRCRLCSIAASRRGEELCALTASQPTGSSPGARRGVFG